MNSENQNMQRRIETAYMLRTDSRPAAIFRQHPLQLRFKLRLHITLGLRAEGLGRSYLHAILANNVDVIAMSVFILPEEVYKLPLIYSEQD